MIREYACQQIVEVVTDYLEGALDGRTSDRFEQHILICPGCAAYLEQMRHTIKSAGQLTVADVPVPMMEVLLQAYFGERDLN